ncbi:MAG: PadR family transcriptional regulator [Kiritimatiellales bacterium]|nr:PadR family transcriptional regulator [Kiritimatiellota bacterium]MBL7012731.1 PadR family transcriptional regulator [Kiritimatiellales bacterium]
MAGTSDIVSFAPRTDLWLPTQKLAIDKSNHQFAPSFGRLYPLLADMEKANLLKKRKEPNGTRGQQIYSLTTQGEERLDVLRNNW